MDISARTLITELAPWPSLVQRMGRCNRTGRDSPGQVYWIDLDDEKFAAPYEGDDLRRARDYLEKLAGASVSPRDLDQFKEHEGITLPFQHRHVLRRRDLLDLFDTMPDLSGGDIDIQRFVRNDDPETDVHVFWRQVGSMGPGDDEPSPQSDELCQVPLQQVRALLEARAKKKGDSAFVWDHLDECWKTVDARSLRPGITLLLPAHLGGYDWSDEAQTGRGWDPSHLPPAAVLALRASPEEGAASDPNSTLAGPPLTIAQHTDDVCQELHDLLRAVEGAGNWEHSLEKAARWHDVGKAHPAFQQALRGANPSLDDQQLWAKSGTHSRLKHGRRHFRHELASALVAWQQGLPFPVAYLIASHHGRARLAIRALPDEDEPPSAETLFALGNHHGDILPEVDLGEDVVPSVALDLTPIQLGGERSWTANSLALLSSLGPFRLAYLEMLLRVADVRASRKEAEHGR
ncbi:MAG: CRISPR-associated endonuclease Cas3'' [Pirellulales bacterium]